MFHGLQVLGSGLERFDLLLELRLLYLLGPQNLIDVFQGTSSLGDSTGWYRQDTRQAVARLLLR